MKYPNIKMPEGFGDKLLKVAAVGVGIYFLRRAIKNAARDSADSQIDTDPDAGHARALNAAMNPSGIDWMRSFDTTNTNAIYEIAPQIISLDKVKDFYKAQTEGRVLHEDLIKEIGAEGYDKFLSLATKGKSGSIKYSPVRPDIKAGLWVVTSAPEAYIRKTPEKKSIHWINHNIIRLVKKGQVLGASTGKFSYDEKNDVTFVEFFTFGVKNKGKQFYWVAKSQVELITKEERAKRDKAGKMPLVLFAGLLGAASHRKQAVTLRNTIVYSEGFKPLSRAPMNIILGFPLLSLQTDKGTYLKVQTIQGRIRWVKQSDIRFQNRS